MRTVQRIGLFAACAALGLAVATAATAATHLPAPGSSAKVKKLVTTSVLIKKVSPVVAKELPDAANDNAAVLYPVTADNCMTLSSCVFGDTASTKSLVIMGDSHAPMWLPALDRIGIAKKLKVIVLWLPVCPAASLSVWLTAAHGPYTSCSTTRSSWISSINALHPTTVLLAERTWGIYTAASGGTKSFTSAQWQAGLQSTITDLSPSKARIAVLGDFVMLNAPVPTCLATHPSDVQECATPNPNTVRPGLQAAEKAAAKATGVLFVNPI